MKDNGKIKYNYVYNKRGTTKIETTFDQETVWLSLDQMAKLFQRDKSTISRHLKNIFNEGELNSNSGVANFATIASDVKKYNIDFYNLKHRHTA